MIPKAEHEHQPSGKVERDALVEAIKEVATDKFGAKLPPAFKMPLKDGDKETRVVNGEEVPAMPGYWFIRLTASKEYPPHVVDGKKQQVTSGWNSGDWGNVVVKLKAFDKNGGKGVGAYLNAVQFLFKDEPLGGTTVGAEVFDEVAGSDMGTATASSQSQNNDDYDPFSDE
jgi:hypothetical protein